MREAYLNYLAALRGLGFTVVEIGGLLKVVPEADAKLQTGTVSVGDVSRRGDQIITQIFRLNHENANNLVPVLRPLISPNNTINANPGSNTLVITDYADNLQRIAKIIAALDTPAVERRRGDPARSTRWPPTSRRWCSGWPMRRRAGAPRRAGRRRPPAARPVLADARSNSLIVRAANPAARWRSARMVEKLDRPSGAAAPGGNIYVVYLRNADATQLATVLRAAFASGSRRRPAARGGGTGGAGSRLDGGSAPAAAARQLGGAAGIGGVIGRRPPRRVTAAAGAVDRRLHPGRPGDQLADHHRARAGVPPDARGDRPARLAARAGLHRDDDRRGRRATRPPTSASSGRACSASDGDKHGVVAGTNFGTGGNNIIDLSAAIAAGSGAAAVLARRPA